MTTNLLNSTIVGADLVVSAVTAPNTAILNDVINLSWTVTNQGDEATSTDWIDFVYLSEDANVDVIGDIGLIAVSTEDKIPLASGSSYTFNSSISLSGGAGTGDRYLLFVADESNEQEETDEGNNVYVVPITLTAPKVDLVVSAVTAPSTALLNSKITASWTITNQGTEGTQALGLSGAVFVSEDETFDPSVDAFLTQIPKKIKLSPGSSYTLSQKFNLPSYATEAGNRYLLFIADYFNEQGEINESNNVQAVPITITTSNVDLVVSEAKAPSQVVGVGSNIDVSWTVTNQGTATARQDWIDSVYLSKDETFDSSDRPLIYYARTDDYTPLAAGKSYTFNQNIDLPSDVVGNYYLLFIADKYNYQAETNNSNNLRAVPLNINNILNGTVNIDRIIGTSENDTITGYGGKDMITGNLGSDRFVYTSITDGLDKITDFQVGVDKIVLTDVLDSLGYTGINPLVDGYARFVAAKGSNTFVQIDPDGLGILKAKNLILVENVSINALNSPANFEF